MNWRDGESNPKILLLFSSFFFSRPLRRTENRAKMSHAIDMPL